MCFPGSRTPDPGLASTKPRPSTGSGRGERVEPRGSAFGEVGSPVSAVIPCRNEVSSIGVTIEALRNQTRPPDEIVVVDGVSTDGTLELLRRLQADRSATVGPTVDAHDAVRLNVVVLPGASIPQAVNAGVRAAAGDVIVRMDAHATPAPDYIERALARLQEPRAGVVGGIWNIEPGAPTATAAAIARAVSHPLGAGDAAYRIGMRDTAVRDAEDVDTVPFGCFTRTTWALLGGLDENLLANEDYEFNHRVREQGLRVILDPAIRSTYYARPTIGALARQYFRYGWWKARMLGKHPRSLRWRQAAPAAFVAVLAGLSLAGFPWRPAWWALGSVLGAYLAVLALASVIICAREGGWSRLAGLIAAFAAVHLAWGAGFVASALRGLGPGTGDRS